MRAAEIAAAGVREVLVFHSSADELKSYGDLPFAVIADPDKQLYTALGASTSVMAMLDPRILPAAMGGIFQRARPSLTTMMHGGPLQLPAEFLIAPDGKVRASKYGAHADDAWSVDELLAAAKAARA